MVAMMRHSLSRAAVVVAVAALLEAVLSPYLTFGGISPKLAVIGVVFAVAGLQDLQAVLLGFFGGVVFDALGGGIGLFGVGALGGLLAGMLAARVGVAPRGAEVLLLAQVAAVAVAARDVIGLVAINLAGLEGPPPIEFMLAGVIPDALVNALLAYAIGSLLLKFVRVKGAM